jgi:hypothetical protein
VSALDRDCRGSVLALVPAAVLVLILLGALAVDSAAAYLAQRQLSDAMAGAANDAATAALSDRAFYDRGQLLLDPEAAASVVCRSLTASLDRHVHLTSLEVAVDRRWVHVRASALTRRIVITGAPLVSRDIAIRAAAAAVAVHGPGDAVPDSESGIAWHVISC